MDSPHFPDLQELRSGIASVSDTGFPGLGLSVLGREENPYPRSYPSEIVTCRCADGTQRRLFCKYMTTLEDDHCDHGMRGGLAYEANIYRQSLRDRIRPAFYGLHTGKNGALWLILECLDDTVPLNHADDESMIFQAAAWLGKFQADQQRSIATERPERVRVYDLEFYRGWARRANEIAAVWHHGAAWLAALCANIDRIAEPLLSSPATLVHGEYYPGNILVQGGEIFIVDWESAAIGAGEIDLAALTEGWPEEEVLESERIYLKARWPAAVPRGFRITLTAARVYLHLRWIGEDPGWTDPEDAAWRLGELKFWAERLGFPT